MGLLIPAAAVGVDALTSDTKSDNVVSVSWPIPVTIGVLQLKIARTTSSVLKLHKSSIDPPPRPNIITSLSSLSARIIIFYQYLQLNFLLELKLNKQLILAIGNLLCIVLVISCIAAPVFAVIKAIF